MYQNNNISYYVMGLCICMSLLLAHGSAICFAQDNNSPLQEDINSQSHEELAHIYYELNPTWRFVSDAIREQAVNMSDKRKLIFVTAMEKMIDREVLKQKSIPVIIDTFTVDELQLLIKFYSQSDIRKALAKEQTYARKIGPDVTQMLDKALLRMKTENAIKNAP